MEKMVGFDQLKETYEGKRVFLTGHTGFKGSWLLLIFESLGAITKGYALAPKHDKDLYIQIAGDSLCQSVIADIRDADRLRKEILDFQPDFIFHMAAQALVIDSYKDPLFTYETNVTGTANVLDALRHLEKQCSSVFITTDKVYENKEIDYAYRETDELGGFDPYSNSKACSEFVISSFRKSFFPKDKYTDHLQAISSARAGNVIGGGDRSENRIIPDIAQALERAEKVIVRNPNAVRPWQHVLDPLNGYLVLGHKMRTEGSSFFEAFNFGPELEDKLSVKDLVETALRSWGSGEYKVIENPNAVHEAGLLMLNIEKAKAKLEWEPKYRAQKAIQETISWYKKADRNEADYSRAQIRNFYA